MAFKYRPSDDKTVKERATQQGGSFDSYTNPSFPTFRPAKGKHAIRILPPSSQIDIDKWGDTWSVLIWIHYSIGTDKSSYLCLEKMKEETCPLCEARAEQNADREEDDKEDPLKPGKRALAWVIDRDNEKDGPLLWAMPWTVERDIQALRIDKKLGVIAIDDPDNGYDVEFVVEGEKLTTKYVGMRIARDSTPLSDNQKRQDKWLDFIEENALPDVLKFYEDTYLDKVYRGKISRKDDDETSSRKSSKKNPRDDDDDNSSRRSAKPDKDEDEDTENDTRSSKRTRKDEDVDDDDDKDERKSTRPSTKRPTSRDEDDDKDTKKSRNDEAKERIKNLNKRSRDDDDNEEEDDDDDGPSSNARAADSRKPRDGAARSAGRGRTDDDDDDNRSSKRRPSSRDDD